MVLERKLKDKLIRLQIIYKSSFLSNSVGFFYFHILLLIFSVYGSNIRHMKILLKECKGFQWDEGNSDKNWIRHRVTRFECEELFFNQPLIIKKDSKHSKTEIRYYSLGRTDSTRFLFISFAIREKLIRVISVRDMTTKERKKHEEKIKRYTNFQK